MPDETYRLTQIETEEVSLVDAAANGRKLLVVKRHNPQGANMAVKTGAEVVEGANGGHQVAKSETPAAPAIKLSTTLKADLTGRIQGVLKSLTELAANVEKATVDDAVSTLPDDVAELLGKALTPAADVAKGLKQFTNPRIATLEQLQGTVASLIAEVKGAAVGAAPPAPAAAAAAPSAVDVEATVAKAVKAAIAPIEKNVAEQLEVAAGAIENISVAVDKQAKIIAKGLKGPRSASNAGASDGARPEKVTKQKSDKVEWPTNISKARREAKKAAARA